MVDTTDNLDILQAVAHTDDGRTLWFGTQRQDRRTYFKLQWRDTADGPMRSADSLTDAAHARETIAYWRSRGWIA